ncbi:DUF3995 domain-containing protein [Beijerinckia indica]|uniref:DUF3995 domain-containing protein n=1 Tax=Beijerinckia indica subsp. indica (strain ATCC 9039 / DSM 1715 / NCIMB 8712) TaxID=395963 RepID=B2IKJ7_BEII9|nr:DUF3995 domain-containing protein [Beijerinckia indica]ACB96477.1 conserved hypothetical protein [Beijerinckia indica subsp. indica ATCC 9039]
MIGALFSIITLSFLALLHAYWAAGGRFGKEAAIPEQDGKPVFQPRPLGTLAVSLALALAALLISIQAGFLLPGRLGSLPKIATGLLALVFAARAIGDFRYVGFFKRIIGTRFARRDTWIYSPLCGLLAMAIADITFSA